MNGFVDETFVIFNINLETDLLGIFFYKFSIVYMMNHTRHFGAIHDFV